METLLLCTDFGLVVLVWIVQLIIYPGFAYYEPQTLLVWHEKYTRYITIIVMPLMVSQVLLHGWELLHNFSWLQISIGVMIVSNWLITFLFAVPLHRQLSQGNKMEVTISSLIKVNWSRTVLWTLIFMVQCTITVVF